MIQPSYRMYVLDDDGVHVSSRILTGTRESCVARVKRNLAMFGIVAIYITAEPIVEHANV